MPDPKEIDYCRPNLTNAIQRLKPRVIVPFGLPAVRSVIGPLFREDVGSMFRWAGFRIPLRRYNAWILPTFSPLSLLEKGDTKSGPALRVWFERHLQDAATVEGTPWPDGPPDYVSQVHIEMNPEHAAAWIRDHMRRGGGCSFDYETNDTKPDRNGARIVSCAVCWRGRETIAFPWVGAVIPAMREFLSSDVPKIGANCKFEDRWTMREFGFPVRNWQWDCMLSAHHLDNRRGITGAKFQAFVRLGLEPWNVEVERFFSATDPETGFNQIDRIDLRALLRYNGIDAVVEYYLANAQRREMNAGRLFDA